MAIVKKTSEINLSRKETSVAIEEVKSNSAVPKAITPAVNENIPIAKSNTSVLESTTSDSSSQVQTQGVSNFRPKRSSKVVAAQGRSAKMVKSKSRSKAKNQKSVYFGEQY